MGGFVRIPLKPQMAIPALLGTTSAATVAYAAVEGGLPLALVVAAQSAAWLVHTRTLSIQATVAARWCSALLPVGWGRVQADVLELQQAAPPRRPRTMPRDSDPAAPTGTSK